MLLLWTSSRVEVMQQFSKDCSKEAEKRCVDSASKDENALSRIPTNRLRPNNFAYKIQFDLKAHTQQEKSANSIEKTRFKTPVGTSV